MKSSIKWHGSSLLNQTRAFIYGMAIVHFVLYHDRSDPNKQTLHMIRILSLTEASSRNQNLLKIINEGTVPESFIYESVMQPK